MSSSVKDATAADSSEDTGSKASIFERSDVEAGVEGEETPQSSQEEQGVEDDGEFVEGEDEPEEEFDDERPVFTGGQARGKVTGPVSGGGKPVNRPTRPVK